MNKKRLLVLAAGILQVPVIKRAREMGVYVIAADGDPNACGLKYADKPIVANITSEEEMLRVAREENIDGVIHPCSEVSMNVMGRINDERHLSGISKEQAIRATNKHLMREAFEKAGAPSPKSFCFDNADDAWECFCKEFQSDGILKPSLNSGSRGVAKIGSGIKMDEFARLFEISKNESRDKQVMLEQFIEGSEFSIEIIVWNGHVNVLTVTDKKTTEAPHFVELGHNQPSCFPTETVEKIKAAAVAGVKALGVNNCACHAEVKVQDGDPYIMEIGARMGGDFISTILTPLSTGVDMIAAAVNCALGIEPCLKPTKKPQGVCIRYFCPKPGVLKGISNIEILNDPRVYEWEIYHKVGDIIPEVTSSLCRSGHIIVAEETPQKAIELADRMISEVKFETEKMDKKLILAVIGAGEGAYPILERAQTLDYVTTLAFGHDGSLAQHLADIFVDVNIFDIEKVISACKEYNVDGLIATSESTTEVAAIIADKLGLLGNDVSEGFGARNKTVMRERVLKVTTVKQPWFRTYEPNVEYEFPIIVKAPDSCGKRGISIAHNDEELKAAVAYSKEYSDCGDVLIEQYLEGGKEYSIECLAGNGLYEVIQYTEKDSSGPPHFVENGHHQPADLTDEMKLRIQVAVKDILKAIGIKCGLAHMELKIINDEIYFIEVGARGGGDHIADTLTVRSTDFDYFKAAIDCCLGRYEHQDVHNVAYAGIYFHCKANEHLAPVFKKAKTADWCICNTVKEDDFHDANSNVETAGSGYIIYCSDRKITKDNY